MFNKKWWQWRDCAVSNGDNSTVSALEKQQQVKLEAYRRRKSNRIFKRKCCAVWIKSRPFRLTIYFYNRNVSSFIC